MTPRTSGRTPGRTPRTTDTTRQIGDRDPDDSRLLPLWEGLGVINAAGRSTTISYGWAIEQGWLPEGLRKDQYLTGGYVQLTRRAYYNWSFGNLVGGRGGGRAAPTYQAPATDFVRENMKAYVVATTGKAHDDLIEQAVNEYLKQDKARFQAVDAPEDIDPFLAAKGVVRNSKWYKAVQGGRPDSVDEMEWVVDRQRILRDLGLNAQTAEDLGIVAAQGSATPEGLIGAARIAQVGDTGRLLRQHREELISKAAIAMSLV